MSSGSVEGVTRRPSPLSVPDALSGLATLKLSFPADHVLLITLNRPKALNVLNEEMERELGRVMQWADEDKNVWIVILTGAGSAFCAGGDLKPALDAIRAAPEAPVPQSVFYGPTDDGFGHLSRRPQGSKPVIAAVNALAVGGGVEMVLNCDLVVASETAKFGFAENKNGLVAIHGAIPRLARTAGHQLASEVYFSGRTISAQEAHDRFGFVNRVVPAGDVLSYAVEMAGQIVAAAISASKSATSSSPGSQNDVGDRGLEAIQVMKRDLIQSWDVGVEGNLAKL